MSASDSDSSIDWLANDDDEEDKDVGRTANSPPALESSCISIMGGGIKTYCDSTSLPNSAKPLNGLAHTEQKPIPQKEQGSPCDSKSRPQLTHKRSCCSSVLLDPRDDQLSSRTGRDKRFADMCRELQCFIRPLSSILNALQSGRYRERLSSFQESVAIDRLQRIMGVLQNPAMGERYIGILLKVEQLLKTWFPHIKPRSQNSSDQIEDTCPLKKHKLSPSSTSLPIQVTCPASHLMHPTCSESAGAPEPAMARSCSTTSLKWLHVSPICSPTMELMLGNAGQGWGLPYEGGATQDSAISSSSDINLGTNLPVGELPQAKINAPCLEKLLKATESIIDCKSKEGSTGSRS